MSGSPHVAPDAMAMTAVTFRSADPAPRVGLKGPGAAAWLTARGVPVPAAPNRWLPYGGGVCLRLGLSEFFVSGSADAQLAAALEAGGGVYPVLRQDAAYVLAGTEADAVLEQACAVDFRAAALTDDTVVLASMLGIAVQVIWRAAGPARAYHLWCDPSYGAYFAAALGGIVSELGGSTSLKAGGKG